MLCNSITERELSRYAEEKWLVSRKFDGERVMVFIKECGEVEMLNRRNSDISFKFPEIVKDIAENFKESEVILDGEISLKDGENFNLFQKRALLQNKFKIKQLADKLPCCLYLFDLLSVGSASLIDYPLSHRLELLKNIRETEHIKIVEHNADIKGMWERAEKEGWGDVLTQKIKEMK